jgi:hypothetical protein
LDFAVFGLTISKIQTPKSLYYKVKFTPKNISLNFDVKYLSWFQKKISKPEEI